MQTHRWSLLLLSLGLLLISTTPTPAIAAPQALSAQGIPKLPKAYQKPCKLVLLHFYASGCHTCQLIHPWVQAFQAENAAALSVVSLNVDDPIVAPMITLYQLQSTPMLVLYNTQGQAVYQEANWFAPKQLQAKFKAQVQRQQPLLAQGGNCPVMR